MMSPRVGLSILAACCLAGACAGHHARPVAASAPPLAPAATPTPGENPTRATSMATEPGDPDRRLAAGATSPVTGGGTEMEPTEPTDGYLPPSSFGTEKRAGNSNATQPPPEVELQAGNPRWDAATIQRAQKELARRGYPVGNLDGTLDDGTRDGIRAFQQHNGLAMTGQLDERTLHQLDVPLPTLTPRGEP